MGTIFSKANFLLSIDAVYPHPDPGVLKWMAWHLVQFPRVGAEPAILG